MKLLLYYQNDDGSVGHPQSFAVDRQTIDVRFR